MATKESIISNSSYTNKDFQSIYPAMLDLVKKITYRWDPSISNESDPGVILLKLNALIADKCNYNIDKNVLECFPLSVTQDRNARQLFEQLGYYMHWYVAATGQIGMRWISLDDALVPNFNIPKFTMVTDEDEKVVYTIVDDLPMSTDRSYTTFNVIQGPVADYSLNGSTLITAQNLDRNNRLYFEETNVAQNGIFIKNTNVLNYDEWVRKDNLTVEAVSSNARNYKFGVTLDTNVCYIEFPTNAEELIGDGIEIKYIKTDGYSGNIAPFVLNKFYDNLIVNNGGTQILLNNDNVQITNFSAIVNGEDTEDINSAYEGYKKIVGTFDTLVTLRDYINALSRFPNVSNCFVTDRTDDINLSANIMQVVNSIDQRNSVPILFKEDPSDDGVEMFPYTLNLTMLYARDEYSDITSLSDFNNTFRLLDDVDLENTTSYVTDAKAYLNNEKHIQQEFINPSYKVNNGGYLLPNTLCFLKNKYKIDVKITPQYKLTQIQTEEMQSNVSVQLLNNLNSKHIEFGDEIDYDNVYDLIINCDERIKSINLEDITYETYAVVFEVDSNTDTASFAEYRIDDAYTPDSSEESIINNIRNVIIAKNILAGKTPFYVKDKTVPEFKINQSSVSAYSSVNSIEIAGNLPWEESSTDSVKLVKLGNNEIARFYAPNLITTDTYASYVKYEYSLISDVEAESSYRLSSNEYIAFYWSGGEDSGYNYAVYGEGTIIKPSFFMAAGTTEVNGTDLPQVFKDKLNEILNPPKSIRGVTYQLATEGFNDIGDRIQQLSIMRMVLSSSEFVSIQTKNQITLDPSYWCAWSLNEKSDRGTYVLFEDGETTRILKQNEYFMYTNAQKSSLVILGQGSQLVRSWSDGIWECAQFDYTSVVSDGLEALEDTTGILQQIPSGCNLVATEMQYIAMSSGAEIKFELADGQTMSQLSINNTKDIDDTFSAVSYRGNSKEAFIPIPVLPVSSTSEDLIWKLELDGVIDIPVNSYMTLESYQSLIINDGTSHTVTNKNISSTEDIYGENVVTFEVDNPTVMAFVLSDDIKYAGSDDVSIDYADDGSIATMSFMNEHATEGVVSITLPVANQSKNCLLNIDTTALPGGIDSLSLTYKLGSSSPVTLLPGNVYSEYIPSTYSSVVFTVSGINSNISPISVKVSNFKPVTNYWGANASSIKAVIDSIISNQVKFKPFDYSYTVDEDELIENPLDAKSFFDFNHEYNKFTIAQLDTDSLNTGSANYGIHVTNKVR